MIIVFDEMSAPSTQGTSLKGYVNLTYNQLVEVLGEPTFKEESGDGKTQKEWVVEFKDEWGDKNVFTIYDWKTYDVEYTMNELNRFNVGGKTSAYDFINYLEGRFN
jgi:hypothetical protein